MQKSKKILQMEKELAKAKAEEAKETGKFNLWVKDDEDISEISVHEKELSKFDKAEMIDSIGEIAEAFEYLKNSEEGLDSTRTGYWLKLMFLLDKPFEKFLAIVFDLENYSIPAIPNVEVFGEIVEKHDWLGKEAHKIAEQFEAIVLSEQKK